MYFSNILVYVDNIIHLAEDNKPDFNILNQYYGLKEGSVGPSDIYWRKYLKKWKMDVFHGRPHVSNV